MLALLASGASAFVAPTTSVLSQSRIQAPAVTMSGAADDFVPDMQRRTIMNLVLLGGAALPVGWMGGGFVYFFVPPGGAHVEALLRDVPRDAPIVSVLDGHPAALGWLGSVYGHRVSALGVGRFGQSGDVPDLYEYYGASSSFVLPSLFRPPH